MNTITLPKTEYKSLVSIKQKYETIRKLLSEDLFSEPPTKDTKKIVKDFRATGLYSEEFLKDLKNGLEESSYFN